MLSTAAQIDSVTTMQESPSTMCVCVCLKSLDPCFIALQMLIQIKACMPRPAVSPVKCWFNRNPANISKHKHHLIPSQNKYVFIHVHPHTTLYHTNKEHRHEVQHQFLALPSTLPQPVHQFTPCHAAHRPTKAAVHVKRRTC